MPSRSMICWAGLLGTVPDPTSRWFTLQPIVIKPSQQFHSLPTLCHCVNYKQAQGTFTSRVCAGRWGTACKPVSYGRQEKETKLNKPIKHPKPRKHVPYNTWSLNTLSLSYYFHPTPSLWEGILFTSRLISFVHGQKVKPSRSKQERCTPFQWPWPAATLSCHIFRTLFQLCYMHAHEQKNQLQQHPAGTEVRLNSFSSLPVQPPPSC